VAAEAAPAAEAAEAAEAAVAAAALAAVPAACHGATAAIAELRRFLIADHTPRSFTGRARPSTRPIAVFAKTLADGTRVCFQLNQEVLAQAGRECPVVMKFAMRRRSRR
jgi:hypothetical protein